jgi:hypothetical protein
LIVRTALTSCRLACGGGIELAGSGEYRDGPEEPTYIKYLPLTSYRLKTAFRDIIWALDGQTPIGTERADGAFGFIQTFQESK